MGILAHAFPPGKIRSIAFSSFAAGAPLGAFTGMALGAVLTPLSKYVINFMMLKRRLTICLKAHPGGVIFTYQPA